MAIADPDFVLQLAKAVGDIYSEGVTHLLQLVAHRLATGIEQPGWAERKLLELTRLRDEAQQEINHLTDDGPTAAVDALRQAVDAGTRTAAAEVRTDFIRTNEQAVSAIARATIAPAAGQLGDVLGSMHLQILRSTVDIYRSVVAETSAGVLTGSQTRLQVAQRALNRFAQNGITGFVDQSGRNWEAQSYVEMATRTATSRAMVQGRLDVYQASGRQYVIVSDSPQECKLCRPWEGKVLAISPKDVGDDPGDGRRVVASVLDATSKGLFHANCFPADVIASSGAAVRAADARWYEGDLVVIHTASGNELPVTPNHPILTTEGWVAAGSLHVGHQLVGHFRPERMDTVGPHDHLVPTSIGDVGDALGQAGPVRTVSVPASAEQFHGDGLGGDVHVVFADRTLQHRVDRPLGHPCGHQTFVVGGVGLGALLADRPSGQVGVGALHADHGPMGGGDLGGPLGVGHGGPLTGLGLAAADAFAPPFEQVGHGGLVDADGGRNLVLALAGAVELDDVIRLGRRQVRCHVYNLQTDNGWYAANGIVVHNCRHDLRPYIPGLTPRTPHTADPQGDAARQQQRYLEQGVRKWKRVQASAMSPDAEASAGNHVQQWQGALKTHLADNPNLTPKPNRTSLRAAR